MPFYFVWPYFHAISMGRASVAMDTAKGIGLAFASEDQGQRARDAAFDEAYPAADQPAG